MATVFLRAPTFRPPPPPLPRLDTSSSKSSGKQLRWVSLRPKRQTCPNRFYIYPNNSPHSSSTQLPRRLLKLLPFASSNGGETTETEEILQAQEPQIQDNVDGAVAVEDSGSDGDNGDAEEPSLAIIALLKSYKEAIASNDESKVTEIESVFKSIEDEKNDLEKKVGILSEELSYEKERILRISADFDNFRKRTERERLSLVTNAQGEVVETLLGVLDNFERAKAQIKVETEGEGKINNSYQSIYKQFVEILESLRVVPVETVGKPFDPLLHEAIIREESTEFEEDIIIEEYRKGFKLGDRLLRPSMVKVSAGPGPAKPEPVEPIEVPVTGSETSDEGSTEAAVSPEE